jgi:hypothetical protein
MTLANDITHEKIFIIILRIFYNYWERSNSIEFKFLIHKNQYCYAV